MLPQPCRRDLQYKRYLLIVLLVIQAFNYMDGLALGLALQGIKADLHVSDTQLGLLSGIAFSFFYSVMGIPIGRWADRGNRIAIISITTALWSVAVASCGLAKSFVELLLVRVAVAVGEAGCIPPAHSLIAEYFVRGERPRAMGVYMLGAPLSAVLGLSLAGWLNEVYGWRLMFVVLGLPGIGLSVLAWLTLSEPRRHSPHAQRAPRGTGAEAKNSSPSVRSVCSALWHNRTFRHLLLSFSVVYFFGYGIAQWQPAFFVRSYHVDTGTLGTWLSIIYGLGGMLGTYLGGLFASRHAANNERLQLKLMAVANVFFGAVLIIVYVTSHLYFAFALLAVAAIGGGTTNGPLFASIQTVVPPSMRAIAVAVIYLFANLIGRGLGPLAAGMLSDILSPILGEQSLRYSLLVLCPGYFWGAWHLWRASRTVDSDLQLAQLVQADAESTAPGESSSSFMA